MVYSAQSTQTTILRVETPWQDRLLKKPKTNKNIVDKWDARFVVYLLHIVVSTQRNTGLTSVVPILNTRLFYFLKSLDFSPTQF